MACVRMPCIMLAAMFLCMLLHSTFTDGHVTIVQHHMEQQTGPTLTKAQESVIRMLEFLARLNPKYQGHLDSYLTHIGAARLPTSPVPMTTTLGPQTVAPMTPAQPMTAAPMTTIQPTMTSVAVTTQTVPLTTDEVEMEEMTSPTTAMETTASGIMTTEKVEVEEMTSPSSAMETTASGVMTTEEVEVEEMTSPSNVMTTEEVEQEEATLPAGQTTSAEPPEEEEPEEIILPLTQTFQCTRFEGVCLRQCETPADVIRGVSCGRDGTGQTLLCCDD